MDEVKQEKLPIDAKLLSEAVIELNISRRSVGLYPPEHPFIKGSINRAYENLMKLFELRSSITLGIAKDALVIDEYALEKENPVFKEFALSLHSKCIAAITFYSGLEDKELIWLHELITVHEGLSGEGLVELAEKKGFKHIEITPVDLSVFKFMEGHLRPGDSERKIWEDYVHGLIEGRLAGKDAADVIINIPPEEVASIVSNHLPENASEETYDRVISTYLRKRGRHGLSREIFGRFLSFINNLKPELKAQFLQRAFSQPSSRGEVETMLTELRDDDLKKLFDVFEGRTSMIPESLKNLIDKLIDVKAEHGLALEAMKKGGAFMDDIEIDDHIVRLLEEDHFKSFVGEEYQRDLEMMLKGIQAKESQLAEILREECGEKMVDRTYSEVIFELLESGTSDREEYLKLLTTLSKLVNTFLETGRLQELCAMYNIIYSQSISGRFKTEASGMIQYFFQSEQFILQLIDALRFWGRYDRESAVRLARVLRLHLIRPLLDTLAETPDAEARKFFLSLLSNMGSDVIPEAVKRLNDKRWYVVRNMIFLIRECGRKEYLKHVRPFTRDKNKKICMEALKTLLHYNDREGISCLRAYLRSDDPELIRQSVILSGTYRVRDVVPYLIGLLEKRDIFGSESHNKIPVIRALAQIGDSRAVEALEKLYTSKGLLFRGSLNELKLELFRTIKGYPIDAIRPLLELGLKSRNKEIRSICDKLLTESSDSEDENG
ncbi:MAG: HEAT repeat domain-containing protein [Nitrospira sp.]|nr:HEAT repeat domain-containing protein [Nitrospira sp.]